MDIIAVGNVPDGFFGDKAWVNFIYDPISGKTIIKYRHGNFTAATPPALSREEAIWLLNHHSNASKYEIWSTFAEGELTS